MYVVALFEIRSRVKAWVVGGRIPSVFCLDQGVEKSTGIVFSVILSHIIQISQGVRLQSFHITYVLSPIETGDIRVALV